jgi:hypothetical protein
LGGLADIARMNSPGTGKTRPAGRIAFVLQEPLKDRIEFMHGADEGQQEAHRHEDDMLAGEREFLWGTSARPDFLAGIALSGGGVRAATVALGVLQTLAANDLLHRFHYISTVSGGGYIGSALSWFWSKKRHAQESRSSDAALPVYGARQANFPFKDKPENTAGALDPAIKNLEFLRKHGSYLTSGDGIGFAGLLVALTRTIIVSLTVWLPLLVCAFGVLEVIDYHFTLGADDQTFCPLPADWQFDLCNWLPNTLQSRPSYLAVLILTLCLVGLFVGGVIIMALLGRIQIDPIVTSRGIYSRVLSVILWCLFAVVLLLLVYALFRQYSSFDPMTTAFVMVLVLTAIVTFTRAAGEVTFLAYSGYRLRRFFERWSSELLPISIFLALTSVLPVIVELTRNAFFGSFGGLLSLLSGVATALYGYYLKAKSVIPGLAGQIFAVLGALVFLLGLLIFAHWAANKIVTGGEFPEAAIFAIVVAIVIGLTGSVNAIGLHRFYRDRLMETFMPMDKCIQQGTAHRSDLADILSVQDIDEPSTAGERCRPYHLINAHAIMVRDDEPKVNLRGGDNFLISAYMIGSSSTGWVRTEDFIKRNGALTLATAMAASGAAANGNAGYVGTGLTRERFVAAVMSLLNIRLGIWIGNPNPKYSNFRKIATYFHPLLTNGIFRFGNKRSSGFLEISDGGHFENLGLYELIRRKLDLILVVDAEKDDSLHLTALVSSMNRIKEDFGATISFDRHKGPELLIGQESDRYPSGVRIAKSPFVVGEITYGGKEKKKGILIYIKATMMSGLDFVTDGYKASNSEFPHQSTIDQFFDPDQFDAYRDLGKKSCQEMVDELKLDRDFQDVPALLARYRAAPAAPVPSPTPIARQGKTVLSAAPMQGVIGKPQP